MSAGLLTKAHVARWLGVRPQDIQGLIDLGGLPAVSVPSATRENDRIPLHGLHRWCKEHGKGGSFMTVDELAHELELCAAGADGDDVERSLLGEMASLSEVITRNLKQGVDPIRTRAALQTVIREWEALHQAA